MTLIQEYTCVVWAVGGVIVQDPNETIPMPLFATVFKSLFVSVTNNHRPTVRPFIWCETRKLSTNSSGVHPSWRFPPLGFLQARNRQSGMSLCGRIHTSNFNLLPLIIFQNKKSVFSKKRKTSNKGPALLHASLKASGMNLAGQSLKNDCILL